MSNIASLYGGPVGIPEPNDHCIQELRDLLKMAEAGELVGIAVAGLVKDGCGMWRIAGRVGGYSMLGALEMVRTELVEVNRVIE